MSFLGILLIIVLCWYLLKPLLAPLIRRLMVWQMQRQMQRMMDQAFGSGSQQQRQQQKARWWESRQENPRPRKRKGKIFTKDVGEYVDFEEIQTFHANESEDTTKVKYKEEAQVTDVEWEDI